MMSESDIPLYDSKYLYRIDTKVRLCTHQTADVFSIVTLIAAFSYILITVGQGVMQ